MNDIEDDPRDAHLLAALRHAPDRDAVPPREVSERILAAARAAVRTGRAASPPWWQRASAWLMQPQVAASFATLAVATLLGVMWSTREVPVAEPQRATERLEQRPQLEPSAPASSAQTTMAGTRSGTAAVPAPIAPPAPAAVTKEAKARAEPRRRVDSLEKKSAAPAADLAGSPRAAAAPAPQGVDAPAPAVVAERRANAAADSRLGDRRETDSAGQAAVTAPAAGALRQAAKASVGVDPLAQFDSLLATGGATWSSGGRGLPNGAAQAAWWAQLRRATEGAWQRLPSQAHEAASVSRPPWLVLAAPGNGAASIDLSTDGVQLCVADPRACWRAPITPAQHDAWIAEVARW